MQDALKTAKTLLQTQRQAILRLAASEHRVPERGLTDYLNTVSILQEETSLDLSEFLIHKDAIRHRIEGRQRFERGERVSENPITPWVDKALLLGKIDALLDYIDSIG